MKNCSDLEQEFNHCLDDDSETDLTRDHFANRELSANCHVTCDCHVIIIQGKQIVGEKDDIRQSEKRAEELAVVFGLWRKTNKSKRLRGRDWPKIRYCL